MNILKLPICAIKGHIVDPNESIVADIMHDKRNWLCKCHRCGGYIMKDGALTNASVLLTEKQANKTKMELQLETEELKRLAKNSGIAW